jgi:predicted permease
MQIPIVQGRGFVATDKPDAARVAIINETAARKFFPNENPLGRHVGTSPETANEMEIVGVVADARYNRIRDAAPPTLYFSHAQRPNTIDSSITFEVRAAAEAGTVMPLVRQAVHDVDPDLPVFAMSTQAQQIDNRLAVERIFAQSYSLFGGLALLLASIGLFALMSYNVARRTTEIGIRLAIGAQPLDVLAMVLRESAVLVSAGLLIGLVTALAAGRSIASLLFGVAPTDLFTMSMALLVMVSICMFAAFLPARRASRVDPMVALRHE